MISKFIQKFPQLRGLSAFNTRFKILPFVKNEILNQLHISVTDELHEFKKNILL